MKWIAAIGIVSLLFGCGTYVAVGSNNQQTEAQCRKVINAMAQDIVGLKTGFVELANFSAPNPVVMGNVIPEAGQVQDLRITYFHNSQYVKGKDKTQGNHQPNLGGCIIQIQLFPDGGSWPGFRSDEYTRNLDRRSEKTGVRLQASIQTQNKELAARLEASVRKRFMELE